MALKKIISACFLILFCMQANAQVEVELDHVQGMLYCSFKESKTGDYSYCRDKAKTIAISVSFGKAVSIIPHPSSISIDYVYKHIANYFKNLDLEVDEFKYDVKFLPSTEWEGIPKKIISMYMQNFSR